MCSDRISRGWPASSTTKSSGSSSVSARSPMSMTVASTTRLPISCRSCAAAGATAPAERTAVAQTAAARRLPATERVMLLVSRGGRSRRQADGFGAGRGRLMAVAEGRPEARGEIVCVRRGRDADEVVHHVLHFFGPAGVVMERGKRRARARVARKRLQLREEFAFGLGGALFPPE